MKSNSLALRKLVVAREGAALTAPIDVEVNAGEMLLVRGSNGAGKSTLLKTVAGLIPIHSGEVRINDVWPAEQPILYLGHKRGLTLEMTVHDNVTLWGKLAGTTELVPAALHYFDLTDIADVPLFKLSAGWQQRVALTRLITIQSSLWLLDEPAANLDAEGMSLLQSLMQTRLEQQGIILVATHTPMEGEMIKTLNINIID